MSKQKKPVPGEYYINLTGQLIKVRYLLYNQAEISLVMLEYQDGHRLSVQLDEWHWLDLKPYSDWFFGDTNAETELEG